MYYFSWSERGGEATYTRCFDRREERDKFGADFERWPYKRASTVIEKLHDLYTGWAAPIYADELKRSVCVVVYPTTPDGYKAGPETSIPIAEFLKGA